MPASLPPRRLLLVLAGVRGALSLLAIPLAPVLYDDHFLAVVILRPTKEVLLVAGYLIRDDDLGLLETVLATVPLMLGGVWLFYWLGRAYQPELRETSGLGGWAGRLLPIERIHQLCEVLDRKGRKVILFGRLAVFPSSSMAAAAGVAGMEPDRFHLADGLGALLALTEVLAVGYLLGETHEEAGPWLTAVGVVVTLGLLVAFGRWLRSGSGAGSGRGA